MATLQTFPLLLISLLVHPVHETVAEIEWNAETRRLEVALRLDALDEQWLRKRHQKGEPNVAKWALPYLQERFRIAPLPKDKQQPDSTTYHWVGRDEEGAHVWWFFEIATADQQPPTVIEQRMLWQREENYTHRILVLDQVPRRSLTLTIQRPKANLQQSADEPNNDSRATPTDRRSRLDRR